MDSREILYALCLTLTPGVGDVRGKKLIEACGSAEAVFKEKAQTLSKLSGLSPIVTDNISKASVIERAEKEIQFFEKFGIMPLLYNRSEYPNRLKHCDDGPLLLYAKGNISLNYPKVLGVVGTRMASSYGRVVCRELISELASPDLLIVSGLALGIDSCAHEAAIDNNLATVGVLAHGLDMIYPASNRELAASMLNMGAIVSDYPSTTKPERENFPKRNRIIAGLCDAVVVVEAGSSGGALITAAIANSYNRDVFAVPGRISDKYSKGCNRLIRNNKAALVESAADIKYIMGWDSLSKPLRNIQHELFANLSSDEMALVNFLELNGESGIDFICLGSGLPLSKTASALLSLEFKGVVRALPGKRFVLD